MRALIRFCLIAAAVGAQAAAPTRPAAAPPPWQEEFGIASCRLTTTGGGPYAVLEPGYRLELEGDGSRLVITVLPETRVIAGVETRVVEEREWKRGALAEVARNYFAMCEGTHDLFYFGEEVDFYEGGKVSGHDGSWLAGTNGNRPGLAMPGAPKAGMRYYQEIAPGVAMDRAEITSVDETCRTPAGVFRNCMKVRETSALESGASEEKYFAPGIGLVRDDKLRLVRHGFIGGTPGK